MRDVDDGGVGGVGDVPVELLRTLADKGKDIVPAVVEATDRFSELGERVKRIENNTMPSPSSPNEGRRGAKK